MRKPNQMPYMRVKRKMASASYPDLSVEQPKLVMARGGKITPSSVPVYDMKLVRNKANDIYGVKQIKSSMDVKLVMEEISKVKNYKPYAVTLLLSSNNTIQDVIEHDNAIYNTDKERAEYLKKVICSIPVGAIICLYNEDLSYDSNKIQFLKGYFQSIGVVLMDVALHDGYNYISEAENQNLAMGGKIKADGVEAYPDLSVVPPKMVMDENSLSKLDRLEMVKVGKYDITPVADTLTVDNWKRASDIFWHFWDKNKISAVEQLAVMYLDKDGKMIGIYTHSWGGRAATIIEPTIIIASAINLKAQAIMVCHNHPSGNLQPSQPDIRSANELYKGCSYVGIQLVDSIIIIPDGNKFTSLSLENHVRFAKGGVMGYDRLVKKVAKHYKGKPVPKKYQSKYGKTYDKDEAKSVGYAVATKVYGKPLSKMADGGVIDLFTDKQNIPPNVQIILDKEEYKNAFKTNNHVYIGRALKEIEAEGYTFENMLDRPPFGLRPIGVPLSQLKGYDEMIKKDMVEHPFEYKGERYGVEDIGFTDEKGRKIYEIKIYNWGSFLIRETNLEAAKKRARYEIDTIPEDTD